MDSYDLPVSGLILLDSPAPSLLTSNPLKDMYTIKLAAVFSFASLLAEFGLLRLANIFGFSIFQPSKVLKDRLGHEELQVLNNFHMDGKGLRMVQSELIGLRDWIMSFKEFKKSRVSVVLICGNSVDTLLTRSESLKDWSETWNNAQVEYINDRNGRIIKDLECDSMSLCVSNQIKPVIENMIQNLKISI